MLNLPFGFDVKFEQYRRDSTYRDLELDLGLQYLFEGGNYLRAFWSKFSTALLDVDETRIKSTMRLPDNLDVSNSSFGLEYNLQRLDYRFNPRQGWGGRIRGSAGTKEIKRNTDILNLQLESDPAFDFASLYDSLDLKAFQYKIDLQLEGYLPVEIMGRGALKGAVNTGIIISNQDIYRNEQYRLGGNRLMRGFDEESVFATRYAVFTAELRYLFGDKNNFYVFTDYGYIEDLTANQKRFDNPLGIGAGMNIETKAGVFGLNLAFGKSRSIPFDFRNPKVHLGYVSYF